MERDYEERYAFKAVLSTSLESYIKLLRDKFPDDKEPLLKFTLKTIDTIYEKPYARKDKRMKIVLGWKIINMGVEVDEKHKQENKDEEI